ncbi:glycosyltransferase family 4 protein [Denitratisoma oestradiolicum]|nr:glycosyltransferase family 1 protein [Denitratisoma oestradiolicum]
MTTWAKMTSCVSMTTTAGSDPGKMPDGMDIALGASILNRGLQSGYLDGIGTYTLHLLEGLRVRRQQVVPYVFSNDADAGLAPGMCAFPGRFGLDLLGAAIIGRPFPDDGLTGRIFHATDHRIPRLRGRPVVATLMDPVPLMRSDWVTPGFRRTKNWFFQRSTQWADRVIAISESAAEDLVEYFRINPNRITVIPLGVDGNFSASLAESVRQTALARHGLSGSFFLFIGTLQPRKNLERIIDAHQSLPLPVRNSFPLVIAGRHGWGGEALVARLRQLEAKGTVRWLNYVTNEEKLALLKSAHALVFPSLYEGFGLPVLEAFASGLPVITSNTTALPEVAGDAALLVDPRSTDEIAEAMLKLVEDQALHGSLVVRGLQRAQQFSWDRCVDATLDVYRQMLPT